MCALREPLGNIGRIETYALLLRMLIIFLLLFIIIIIQESFIIIIGIINIYYCYYLEFYIVPTKQKENRKKTALPTMWK